MSRPGIWVVPTLAAVLALAVAAQWLHLENAPARPALHEQRLARVIDVPLSSWHAKDEPLGINEAGRGRVADILRYDDYVYRRYLQAGREFSVYMAYWKPGKMPTRLIAEHTPDRCWVENGWVCEERQSGREMLVRGQPLPPAEWRRFSPPTRSAPGQYVLFWLLAGGRVYDFSAHQNLLAHAWTWWRGALADISGGGHTEQLFVRVTSTVPFEELARDEEFQAVISKVGELGLLRAARP